MLKLEIGGGTKPTKGYLQMDVKKLPGIDIVGDVRDIPLEDGVLEEVFGHWILEHFYYNEIPAILKEWKRVLKPGGVISMVTNNGEAHIRSYIDKTISVHELNRMLFGAQSLDDLHPGIEDIHKIIWTKELVEHFFTGFTKLEIKETWKHREDNGDIKCPGIIITATK